MRVCVGKMRLVTSVSLEFTITWALKCTKFCTSIKACHKNITEICINVPCVNMKDVK